jgi:hypothetical protein
MPGPLALVESAVVALLASFLTWSAGRWAPRRLGGRALGTAWRWPLAVGLGFYLGAAVLGVRPRWSIREDQDRFLGLILPGILVAEALLPALRAPTRLGLILRCAASAAVAPVLLHGSSYVADLAGPGTAEWPPARRWLIFGVLGLATACNWSCLVWIQARSLSAARVPASLATVLLGAGLVVMFSGYASAGFLALPLSAAILGASLAALLWRADAHDTAPGVGLVGLCGVLTMGAFFGRLRTVEAVILFLAPLLAGVPETGAFSRRGPRVKTLFGIALTAFATALVAASAWRRFAAEAAGL